MEDRRLDWRGQDLAAEVGSLDENADADDRLVFLDRDGRHAGRRARHDAGPPARGGARPADRWPRPRRGPGPTLPSASTPSATSPGATTPGVVNINTSKVVKRPQGPFRDFFGAGLSTAASPPQGDRGGDPAGRPSTSLGSGFVDRQDQGYILTNRHVIEGADEINVCPGRTASAIDAKLVGQDARTDVALIKIEPKGHLTTIALGDSDSVEVGEWVMAVGNPFGLRAAATASRSASSPTRAATSSSACAGHLRRDDPDGCRDQPRQLGRARSSTPAARSSASTP